MRRVESVFLKFLLKFSENSQKYEWKARKRLVIMFLTSLCIFISSF